MTNDQTPLTNTGKWACAEVAGHPCHIYDPPTPSEHGYVVLYLHGIEGCPLSEHPPFCREFDRYGLRVLAPMTGPSWWADRICKQFDPEMTVEQYLLERIVPHIAQRWGSKPPRIGLLGISMGGQGALRLAYKYPDQFPVAAAIAPAIDYQIRLEEGDPVLSAMYRDAEAARQDTATLHIHPLNWPRHQWFCCDPADVRWHDSADRLRMKLFSLGVPHECDLETSAGGHSWQYFEHMAPRAVAFLADGLKSEQFRVV